MSTIQIGRISCPILPKGSPLCFPTKVILSPIQKAILDHLWNTPAKLPALNLLTEYFKIQNSKFQNEEDIDYQKSISLAPPLFCNNPRMPEITIQSFLQEGTSEESKHVIPKITMNKSTMTDFSVIDKPAIDYPSISEATNMTSHLLACDQISKKNSSITEEDLQKQRLRIFYFERQNYLSKFPPDIVQKIRLTEKELFYQKVQIIFSALTRIQSIPPIQRPSGMQIIFKTFRTIGNNVDDFNIPIARICYPSFADFQAQGLQISMATLMDYGFLHSVRCNTRPDQLPTNLGQKTLKILQIMHENYDWACITFQTIPPEYHYSLQNAKHLITIAPSYFDDRAIFVFIQNTIGTSSSSTNDPIKQYQLYRARMIVENFNSINHDFTTSYNSSNQLVDANNWKKIFAKFWICSHTIPFQIVSSDEAQVQHYEQDTIQQQDLEVVAMLEDQDDQHFGDIH